MVEVPLVLAGSGVRRGARAGPARLVDVAPTIAALLGVPAPGHAGGRALVEVLALDPARARAIRLADAARHRALDRAVAGRPDLRPARGPRGLALGAMTAAAALVLALLARGRAISLDPRGAAVAAVAFPIALATLVLLAGGMSISGLADPDEARRVILASSVVAAAVHGALAAWALRGRRHPERIGAAAGIGALALVVTAAAGAAVDLALGPAWLEVPGPRVLFLVPAAEVAQASAALAIALALATELVVLAARVSGRARPEPLEAVSRSWSRSS